MKKALGLACLGIVACQGSNTKVNLPDMTAIVVGALPPALKPSTTARDVTARARSVERDAPPVGLPAAPTSFPDSNSDNAAWAAAYIDNLFQGSYTVQSGSTAAQGYLESQTQLVQSRVGQVNGAVSGAHSCLVPNNASRNKATTVDLSAMATSDAKNPLKLTLPKLSCNSAVNAAGGGFTPQPGSGEVFGVAYSADKTTVAADSIWVSIVNAAKGDTSTAGSDIFLWANVDADASVDGMSLWYTPNADNTEVTVTRFKANKTNTTFEMMYASNRGTLGPTTVAANATFGGGVVLGGGFRMVSDGSHIYADGLLADYPSNSSATHFVGWQGFAVCLDGTQSPPTIDAAMGDCKAAYDSFDLASSAAVNGYSILGTTGAIANLSMPSPANGSTPAILALAPTSAIVDVIYQECPTSATSVSTF